jgi:hypothetical protein
MAEKSSSTLSSRVFFGPSGGPMGAEASLFIFPVILALFLAFHFRFKGARFPAIQKTGTDYLLSSKTRV